MSTPEGSIYNKEVTKKGTVYSHQVPKPRNPTRTYPIAHSGSET